MDLNSNPTGGSPSLPSNEAAPKGGQPSGGVGDVSKVGQLAGTPSVADLTDDSLVRIPGQSEPVKYGELYKRLQADHTRKTQQAEKLRKQWEAEHSTRMGEVASERKRLEAIAATLAARAGYGNGEQGGVDPFLAELSTAQFIDGPTAVKMIQAVQSQMAPIGEAFSQRDQILKGLYTHLVRLTQQVQQMGGRFGTQDFESKIDRYLKEGNYPDSPVARQLAKEIYLAYEGDGLDDEFPTIFQTRWQQVMELARTLDQKKVEAARQRTVLPGRGGNGTAGKPVGLKGTETPKQVADLLWDAIQTGNDT